MNIPKRIEEFPENEIMKKIKEYCKLNGLKFNFKNRNKVKEYMNEIKKYYKIPWREDQILIIKYFFENKEWKDIVVQAIFGGGKTTMILAIIYHLILSKLTNPENVFVCAFNCAIKNELIKKTKIIGKFDIRTFDSLIYKLCKSLDYKDLKLLNFETKRRYIYENLKSIIPDENIEYVFIDESQDLEKKCYFILKRYFINAKFLFVGDIFQSIQKEPRDSLLWYLLNNKIDGTMVFKMFDTPRVPNNILLEMKTSLLEYYPEYKDTIEKWTSSSKKIEKDCKIKWKSFNTYKEVYNNILEKLKKWNEKETMILTFSSSVTVRGSLGDISRFRRFFYSKNIKLNSNHKRMNDESLFLTTVNSSKGLERRNVIVVITFPLENAFSNFSNDLVMNLITVALSRTKKNIIFYVPNHIDRYSDTLYYFKKCPQPLMKQSIDKKEIYGINLIEMEHSITEILRQNILSFETRELLISYTKMFNITDNANDSYLKNIQTDEECTLLGLIFEGLILSKWTNHFPKYEFDESKLHLLFQEQLLKIKKMIHEYDEYTRNNPIINEEIRITGCYKYAQLHLLINHKMIVHLNDNDIKQISDKWNKITKLVENYKIDIKDYKLKVQQNITMPFLNGIIDASAIPNKDNIPLMIYEIKASRSNEWRKMALLQAILYGILSVKDYFTIHLINVFGSKFYSYNVSFKKNLMNIRNILLQDIMNWNINCFLSKNIKTKNNLLLEINYSEILLIESDEENVCICYFESQCKVKLDIFNKQNIDEINNKIDLYRNIYGIKNIYSSNILFMSEIDNIKNIYKEKDIMDKLLNIYKNIKIDLKKCYNKISLIIISLIYHYDLFNDFLFIK